MTVLETKKIRCAVCGRKIAISNIVSCSSSGSPGLDNCPPPSGTFALSYRVQLCPKCGYAGENIEKKSFPHVEEIVFSKEYQKKFKEKKENSFLKEFDLLGYLYEVNNLPYLAALTYLNVAWIVESRRFDKRFEDYAEKIVSASNVYRKKSLIRFMSDLESALNGGNQTCLIIVDLFRRMGKFETAIAFLDNHLQPLETNDEKFLKLVRYETFLCKKKDDDYHTIEEATAFNQIA